MQTDNLRLGGLHHVTAITGDAAGNVAFYTQVLGLRLVKKTVNQDDVSAYHLFYGDAVGHAGTELTFFDWPQASNNRPGVGTIAAIALRVPHRAALMWWKRRFEDLAVTHGVVAERAGRATLPFSDPEGQQLELVAPGDGEEEMAGGTPWDGSPVPQEYQIRGLHAVRLLVAHLAPTVRVLTGTLGFEQAGTYTVTDADGRPERQVTIFKVGAGGPGTEVHLEERSDLPRGLAGIGGVHHVAFRTPNDEEHLAWRRRVLAGGLPVTPQIDRYYFRSIYFREPGGVLFEIATDGPGFATDEDVAHLGEQLALPPFLEPDRRRIEAGLRPLHVPTVASGNAAAPHS